MNDISFKNTFKKIRIIATSIIVVLTVFTIVLSSNAVLAVTLSKVAIVGSKIKVITFRKYSVNENNFKANIKVPAIQGLKNKALQYSLNEKYITENEKLYEKFMAAMSELKEKGAGNLAISSGYEMKTDNDVIFSVERYVLTIAGSSNKKLKYDTIDKKRQILITLPSLFKDDSYVDVISANIISQMREQMKSQEGRIYWIEGNVLNEFVKPFKRISNEQNFYINKDNNLVISFNKYEVAPGVMGTPEFVIPTTLIRKITLM